MRNKIIIGFLGIIGLIFVNSCTKNTSTLIDVSTSGAYLTFDQPVPTAPAKYDYSTIATASASIKVKSVGASVASINIYAGTTSDPTTWKKIKTVTYVEGGVTLTVNGSELATALGLTPADLKPGNTYTFFNELVTKDGRKFSSANTSNDFEGQAKYAMALKWSVSVFCSFDQSVFNGNFKVVQDDWADFAVGDPVAVQPGATANQIVIIAYPAPQAGGTNRKPMVLTVDPATNGVTVAEQIYGDYPPVTNVTARGSGSVNSCTGTITLILTHKYGGTDYAGQKLILKK